MTDSKGDVLGDAGGFDSPERPIAADWLALRRAADERARDAAAPLLADLTAHLAGLTAHLADLTAHLGGARRALPRPGADIVAVVDVGAGTGANRSYLAPRLPFRTAWTLLDHDPALLGAEDNEGCRRVLGGVAELPGLLAELGPGPRLVTCSALLDLLSAPDLDALVEAVLGAGVPALFALTVTGGVRIEPADPDDELVREAFDAHQARAGRPGPGAAEYVAAAVRARSALRGSGVSEGEGRGTPESQGARVLTAPTPWLLGATSSSAPNWRGEGHTVPESAEAGFLRRYLTDRAAAAVEQVGDGVRVGDTATGMSAGEKLARIDAWLDRRLAEVETGTLRIRVDHVDVLILPA